jgi:3-dehydroquinate synthase
MRTIRVELGERSYSVIVGGGTLRHLGPSMRASGLDGRALLVTEPRVAGLHGGPAADSLRSAGFEVTPAGLPEGESAKTLEAVASLVDRMIAAAIPRSAVLVALGGGALSDAAGFAAATYHRGIAHVLVPTTLLAQADASVGGKVAVNRGPAKNVMGAFHQPRLVVCDTALLETLPEEEFRSGIPEIVKHAVIGDPALFGILEERLGAILARDASALEEIVARSIAVKARIVASDERDRGLRAALNFGHTFAHAVESAEGFRHRRHGEALSVGIVAACRLSVRVGLLAASEALRIEGLLARFGLPVRAADLGADTVLNRLIYDKKAEFEEPRFVLTSGVGDVRVGARIERFLLEEVAREIFGPGGR